MVNARNLGIALGGQRRQRSEPPRPAGLLRNLGTLQLRIAADDGCAAIDFDMSVHIREFLDMHEPILENRLRHKARAVGNHQQRHHLRLHISWEAWIRQRLHIDRIGADLYALTRMPFSSSSIDNAHFLHFGNDRRRWSPIAPSIYSSLPVIAAAIIYVPASTRSGMTVCTTPCNFSTPFDADNTCSCSADRRRP